MNTIIMKLEEEIKKWCKEVYKTHKKPAIKHGYLKKEDVKDLISFTKVVDEISPNSLTEDFMYGIGIIQGLKMAKQIQLSEDIIK